MRRLKEEIRRKKPDAYKDNTWILHRGSTPSHEAIIVDESLTKSLTNNIKQPPFSPDT